MSRPRVPFVMGYNGYLRLAPTRAHEAGEHNDSLKIECAMLPQGRIDNRG